MLQDMHLKVSALLIIIMFVLCLLIDGFLFVFLSHFSLNSVHIPHHL